MKKHIFCLALAFLLSPFLFSPITVSAFALNTSCWVDPSKVENTDGHAMYITLAALNLRPQPRTDIPRIALAQQGALVQVTDTRDGIWYAVIFNGLSGYMYAEFLEFYTFTPSAPPNIEDLAAVELIDWQTAKTLLTPNVPFTVIDVRTGISWQMTRFGGDLHADVETLTAECTANMRRAFNNVWSWEPRPVLVIYDGRTLAASINGMPHGIVTNFRNNVNGHFCLHFFGSWAHGATTVDPRHHNAVMEAFFTAEKW